MVAVATIGMAAAQTSRSEVGALISVMSRTTPDQSIALIKGLTALENKGNSSGLRLSWPGAWDLLLGATSGEDRDQLQGLKKSAASFDRESIAILVRDAYFGGIDDGSTTGDTLSRFTPESIRMGMKYSVDRTRVPEEIILMNLKAKMPMGPAATFEGVLREQEKAGRTEGYPNWGYKNSEKILVEALGTDGKTEFVSVWKALSYDDREVCLQLLRDAFLRGLADR